MDIRLAAMAGLVLSFSGQAPVGEFAVASNRDGNWEIYVVSEDGRTSRNLTQSPAMDYNPSWSPDGKSIAFQSNRDGNTEVFVMRADGSEPMNVTRHPASDTAPRFSPDGARLLFVSTRDHEKGEIYSINLDGTGLLRLTRNELYEELPAWSPDGKRIAFCRQLPAVDAEHAGNGDIYVMDADGKSERRLTHLDSFDSGPAWSPDGKRIAFHFSDAESAGIMTMSADGRDLQMVGRPLGDWYPQFLPDGRILFVSGTGDTYDVYVMDPDGIGRRRLTEHPGRDHSPALRPKG